MLGGGFDPDGKRKRITELEQCTLETGFWNDKERTETVFAEMNSLKDDLSPWEELRQKIEDISTFYELYLDEPDPDLEADIETQIHYAEKAFQTLHLKAMLSERFDTSDTFLTIHSGAGGTEACDWVSMLMRMYLRWTEIKGFKVEIIDILEAEGGVKSVTLEVRGKYSYGYLKGESGIHRLVRISPFDSNKRRHTSFASVYVSPVIEEDIDVEIKAEDIRIDTYRASGAGGQHVNKTDSAVRITHLKTNIVVQCQNERSQHKNKAMAMKVLASRLYEYYKQENESEHAKHALEKKDISWGNQIRSYVFHPYTMVKDHRTSVQIGNIQSVMDGNIDQFIEAFLKWNMK